MIPGMMARKHIHCLIDDVTKECADGVVRELKIARLNKIIVHRTIWEPGDAVGICKRFQDPADLGPYTGGENPYHFIVTCPGDVATVSQCIPLDECGAHARRFNVESIAVALAWDTLHTPIPTAMETALINILKPLCFFIGGMQLYGHDEIPGACEPGKVCPGIPMQLVRARVAEQLAPWWGTRGDCDSLRLQILDDCGANIGGLRDAGSR